MALIMRKLFNMRRSCLNVWRVTTTFHATKLFLITHKMLSKLLPSIITVVSLFSQSMRFDFRLANLIGFCNYLYYTSFTMASYAVIKTISIQNYVHVHWTTLFIVQLVVFFNTIWKIEIENWLSQFVFSWIMCFVWLVWHCFNKLYGKLLYFNKKILNKLWAVISIHCLKFI